MLEEEGRDTNGQLTENEDLGEKDKQSLFLGLLFSQDTLLSS